MSKVFSSREVFQWEQFQDLAKRLGIPLNKCLSLKICLEHEKPVTFELVARCENDELKTTDGGAETQVCEALS